MKKLMALTVALGLALLPAIVLAGVIFVPVSQIVYSDLGESRAERVDRGLKVSTGGLEGTGVIDCQGDRQCVALGLDGARVGLRQNLNLLLSRENGAIRVTGRTSGRLLMRPDDAFALKGEVRGKARCVGDRQDSCRAVEVAMEIKGGLQDRDGAAGRISLTLTGILSLHNSGDLAPGWKRLGGKGELQLLTDDG